MAPDVNVSSSTMHADIRASTDSTAAALGSNLVKHGGPGAGDSGTYMLPRRLCGGPYAGSTAPYVHSTSLAGTLPASHGQNPALAAADNSVPRYAGTELSQSQHPSLHAMTGGGDLNTNLDANAAEAMSWRRWHQQQQEKQQQRELLIQQQQQRLTQQQQQNVENLAASPAKAPGAQTRRALFTVEDEMLQPFAAGLASNSPTAPSAALDPCGVVSRLEGSASQRPAVAAPILFPTSSPLQTLNARLAATNKRPRRNVQSKDTHGTDPESANLPASTAALSTMQLASQNRHVLAVPKPGQTSAGTLNPGTTRSAACKRKRSVRAVEPFAAAEPALVAGEQRSKRKAETQAQLQPSATGGTANTQPVLVCDAPAVMSHASKTAEKLSTATTMAPARFAGVPSITSMHDA